LWRKGSHEHVFELIAAGKLREDVIRLHRLNFAGIFFLGSGPQILAVVENLRVRHVEGSVLVGLDREEIFWIAQMLLQIGGEIDEVAEHIRKRLPIGSQDRIFGVHDEEAHAAVVHVHDDLHGVAYVVQTVEEAKE